MAADFRGIIQNLQKLEPSVFGASLESWGADHKGYREQIRLDLESALKKAGESTADNLLDLKAPPHPEKFSVSISHTQGFGAWLACARPRRIGLDIELGKRITKEIVARISTESELIEAPRSEYLWCAKEAYFKALEGDQPAIISQLEIGGWTKERDGVFTFTCVKSLPAMGMIFDLSPYIVAVTLA